VIGAALCVTALAILADLSLGLVQYVISPRGLRLRAAFEPGIGTVLPVPDK
jgi:ABC-type proline/glycine betaine transport system permease subunit